MASSELAKSVRFDPHQEITFSVESDEIARLEESYLPLTINGLEDVEGYDLVHKSRMDVRDKRISVEKQRKQYKEGALEYGRSVDAAAKLITESLRKIEDHLKGEERRIDDEKARLKREEEDRRRAAVDARMERLAAVDASNISRHIVEALSGEEFSELLAEKTSIYQHKQEQARREQEERDRLEAERKEQRRREDEILKQERIKLAEERSKLEAERAEHNAAKENLKEALAKRDALEAAKKKAEQDAAAVKREKEEQAAWEQREKSLRPDRDKLMSVADSVAKLTIDEMSTEAGRRCRNVVANMLQLTAERIRGEINNMLVAKTPKRTN